MNELLNGSAAPAADLPLDDARRDDPPEISEDEQHALRTGWQPLDKFKGDPAKWRPAGEWIERADQFIPIARAENRKLNERVEKLERDLRERDEVINASKQFMTGIEERAKTAAIDHLRAERRQALSSGDGDAFDAADAELRKLEAPATPAPKTEQRQTVPVEVQRVYSDFERDNEWYRTNDDAKDFANAAAHALKAKGIDPLASPQAAQDFLEKVKSQTERAFPELNPRRSQNGNRAPMFDGGGNGAPQQRQQGKRTYERMKPEFQEGCNRTLRSGLVKTREQYVALAPDDAFY